MSSSTQRIDENTRSLNYQDTNPTLVTQNGRKFIKIIVTKQHGLGWQVLQGVKALALTIATLVIGAFFIPYIRESWAQAWTGTERIPKLREFTQTDQNVNSAFQTVNVPSSQQSTSSKNQAKKIIKTKVDFSNETYPISKENISDLFEQNPPIEKILMIQPDNLGPVTKPKLINEMGAKLNWIDTLRYIIHQKHTEQSAVEFVFDKDMNERDDINYKVFYYLTPDESSKFFNSINSNNKRFARFLLASMRSPKATEVNANNEILKANFFAILAGLDGQNLLELLPLIRSSMKHQLDISVLRVLPLYQIKDMILKATDKDVSFLVDFLKYFNIPAQLDEMNIPQDARKELIDLLQNTIIKKATETESLFKFFENLHKGPYDVNMIHNLFFKIVQLKGNDGTLLGKIYYLCDKPCRKILLEKFDLPQYKLLSQHLAGFKELSQTYAAIELYTLLEEIPLEARLKIIAELDDDYVKEAWKTIVKWPPSVDDITKLKTAIPINQILLMFNQPNSTEKENLFLSICERILDNEYDEHNFVKNLVKVCTNSQLDFIRQTFSKKPPVKGTIMYKMSMEVFRTKASRPNQLS
ncbi:MAG: hypothetical protein H0W88_10190 [Parachlamydiaceae bacterium]|nr:hypothetical protein [Parachlamydiaceae bacterium]